MCDKTLKNIGEVKEIINSVAKDDMDSQTLDAKLVHMGQKLNRLKQQILSTDRKHRQEIEKKNKEVNKYLQKQRSASANIQKILSREGSGQLKIVGNISYQHQNQHEETYCNWNKDKAQLQVMLQKQSKLRLITEQKSRQEKLKMFQLQQKLRKSQSATKILKEQSERQKLMLLKMINEGDESSSQGRSEGEDLEAEDEDEEMEVEEEQQADKQRRQGQRQGRCQMMEMTENRCKISIEDQQLYVADTESEEEECGEEEYANYDSDQQAEMQKLSKIIKDSNQGQNQKQQQQQQKQQPSENQDLCKCPQPEEKPSSETLAKIDPLTLSQTTMKVQQIKSSPALSKEDNTRIRGYSWWRSLRKLLNL